MRKKKRLTLSMGLLGGDCSEFNSCEPGDGRGQTQHRSDRIGRFRLWSAGVYGGGPNRGMPTPNIDRLADEGMTFFTFYAQPSCTPGRAAMQTGRIPNRSGMTTVAFKVKEVAYPKPNGPWRPF